MKKIILITILLLIAIPVYARIDYRTLYSKFQDLNIALILTSGQWKYDRVEYNCVDFSKDFREEARERGIESVIVRVRRPGAEVDHALVGVLFDSITGQFVPPDKYYIKGIMENDRPIPQMTEYTDYNRAVEVAKDKGLNIIPHNNAWVVTNLEELK